MRQCLVLVNPWVATFPPLGLCYISAYLKEKLFFSDIVLIDSEIWQKPEAIAHNILVNDPGIIGITASTPTINRAVKIAALIRKKFKGALILGGPHITSLPAKLPVEFDIGIMGEGEETFLEIIKEYLEGTLFESLPTIQGISFHDRKNQEVKINPRRQFIADIDNIPFPDRSILNMKRYLRPSHLFATKEKYRGTTMLTSRGCPYRCIYCQASHQWGIPRYNSSRYVVDEIRYLKERYQVQAINIIDDLFLLNRKRMKEIVELILAEKLEKNLAFNINGHVEVIDREVLELLKSINVKQISYGFESASARILNYLKGKHATPEKNLQALKMTNEYGIGVGGQFMVGTPGETIDDIMLTYDFIKKNKMSHVHVSLTTPLPGTRLWDDLQKQGQVSDDLDLSQLDLDSEEVIPYKTFYFNNLVLPADKFWPLFKKLKRLVDFVNPQKSLFENDFLTLIIKALNEPHKVVKYLSMKIRYYLTRLLPGE